MQWTIYFVLITLPFLCKIPPWQSSSDAEVTHDDICSWCVSKKILAIATKTRKFCKFYETQHGTRLEIIPGISLLQKSTFLPEKSWKENKDNRIRKKAIPHQTPKGIWKKVNRLFAIVRLFSTACVQLQSPGYLWERLWYWVGSSLS